MKMLFKIAMVLVIVSVCLIGCVEEQDPQPHAPNYTQPIAKEIKDVNPSRGQIK
jgi:hypothetical protein